MSRCRIISPICIRGSLGRQEVSGFQLAVEPAPMAQRERVDIREHHDFFTIAIA